MSMITQTQERWVYNAAEHEMLLVSCTFMIQALKTAASADGPLSSRRGHKEVSVDAASQETRWTAALRNTGSGQDPGGRLRHVDEEEADHTPGQTWRATTTCVDKMHKKDFKDTDSFLIYSCRCNKTSILSAYYILEGSCVSQNAPAFCKA